MPTRSEILRLLSSVTAVAVLVATPAARAQSAPEPAAAPADAYAPAPPAPAEPPAAAPYAPPAPAPAAPNTAMRRNVPGTQPRKVGVLLRLNFDFGGETMGTVLMSDGSTQDIKAGQLYTFSGGLFYHPDAPYALEATLGYKAGGVTASNGDITFWRVPFDVIASFAAGPHRIGVGPTVHLSPTYSCNVSGSVCGIGPNEIKFDTAVGGIAQYAYGLPIGTNSGVEVAVRYTFIEYKGPGLLAAVNGSSAGFLLGAWF